MNKIVYSILFLLTFCGSTLAATTIIPEANSTTILTNGDLCRLTTEGATYYLTTDGEIVDAAISITCNCTLVLEDCLLQSTSTSPLTLTSIDDHINLQFKGTNRLTALRSNNATPAIYAKASIAPSLTVSTLEENDTTSELFIRGCSDNIRAYPPINLNGAGTLTIQSGNVRIATTEDKDVTDEYSPYLVPPLASAGTITLSNGTVTAQLCPYYTANGIEGKQLVTSGSTTALFECDTFYFTGGYLTTVGDNEAPANNTSSTIYATTASYDTTYAYPNTLMKTLTTATNQILIGGILVLPLQTLCYGFTPNATIPPACFTHTGSTALSNQTASSKGVVTFYPTSSYPNLTLNYGDSTSHTLASIFNVPLTATESGLVTEATFGISDICYTSETSSPTLTIAADLPGETTALEKIIHVQIFRTTDKQTSELLADTALTFSRSSTDTTRFTATYSCEESLDTVEGTTHAYTVRAHN